jgi:light-regulated signal transduction histidine kinase (bacteriophytochrome)
MIYRFLEDESGQVIAEARSNEVEPFLHHRYPASDIPQQARALYVRNPIRVIQDVGYTPLPIRGGNGPLDLSGALLRSVSPVHIQYLKNMQVGASASVSLVRGGSLWGLIACHHRTPKPIPHEEREMCRHIATVLDQALRRLEEENSQREALRLTRRREELLPVIAAADSVSAGLQGHIDELRRLISADGIALLLDTRIVCSGVTPPEEAVFKLGQWVLDQPNDQLVSETLSEIYPPAAEWTASGSGVVGCVVGRTPRTLILWFRAEEIETVNWAGNPHKAAVPGTIPGQLSPRQSFALWSETVRGTSRIWRPAERDAARRIAFGLAEIGRQKVLADLNRQLTSEVADKDLLMREMHHRVQNSLQLVTSMLQIQEGELHDEAARRQLELARDRVLSVALLHRRLWRSEDLQSINLETFFQSWLNHWCAPGARIGRTS